MDKLRILCLVLVLLLAGYVLYTIFFAPSTSEAVEKAEGESEAANTAITVLFSIIGVGAAAALGGEVMKREERHEEEEEEGVLAGAEEEEEDGGGGRKYAPMPMSPLRRTARYMNEFRSEVKRRLGPSWQWQHGLSPEERKELSDMLFEARDPMAAHMQLEAELTHLENPYTMVESEGYDEERHHSVARMKQALGEAIRGSKAQLRLDGRFSPNVSHLYPG